MNASLQVSAQHHRSGLWLFLLLLGSLLLRGFYLLVHQPLWWDSYVYLGMGQHFFSSGQLGVWETFRPPLYPLMLGLFWWLGGNQVFWGTLLDIVLSLVVVYLTYRWGYLLWNQRVGLGAGLILSCSPLFLRLTGLLLSDLLAMAFGLGGLLLLFRQRSRPGISGLFGISGLLLGLAFLTRFPLGIFFGSVFLLFLFRRRGKELGWVTTGFLLPVLPYLILNYFRYGDPFLPLTAGQQIVTTATWLYGSGNGFYLREVFLAQPAYLLLFPALFFLLRSSEKKREEVQLFLLIGFFTVLYFWFLPRKEARYLLMILPGFALFISHFCLQLPESLKKHLSSHAPYILAGVLLLAPLPMAFLPEEQVPFAADFFTTLEQEAPSGVILTSDPRFLVLPDRKVVLLGGMEYAEKTYALSRTEYTLLFINTCDLVCTPGDGSCEEKKSAFLERIRAENKEVLNRTYSFRKLEGNCTYRMLVPLSAEEQGENQ